MANAGHPLVLIAEDEPKIAAVLQDYARASQMHTVTVSDGNEVVAAVREREPDVLLLDIMLPNKDGMEICREIRGFSNLPIIMVTARVEEIDRLLGLGLGADDYICKPFSPREVIARIKSVLRRAAGPQAPSKGAVTLEVDTHTYRASLNGRRLDLTPVEFKLLAVLARQVGRVHTREQLLDQLYDDFRDNSDRTIDTHVKNLRRKIDAVLPHHQIICSVYGVGYKLELPR